MGDLNIVFNQKRKQPEQEYVRNKLGEGYNIYFPNTNSEDEIIEHIKDADILVGTNVTKKMLDESNLKFIQIPHAGVDRLDIELVRQYDIEVYNSHSNSLAVAEFAVGLMLSIAKKIPYHDKLFRTGKWNIFQFEDTREAQGFGGSYLSNKIIGFIGYGNIAQKIARLLKGFDCKYMAIVTNKSRQYDELDFIGDREDLDYVLRNSDYIVVAAPLTEKTRGMLNKENLIHMKDSAFIINISRGKLIDEESLYYMLENNLIRGAAIDAWYNYPIDNEDLFPSNIKEFKQLHNLIMSPHRAEAIYDEVVHIEDVLYNIQAYKEGRELINRVDLNRGY